MFPILLRIGKITLRTYGFFVATGVLVAYNYVKFYARKKNIDILFLSNLIFYTVIFGFLGARLFYVLLNFDYYRYDLLSVFKIWEGGLVFYGGFLSGLIFGIIYVVFKKQNLLKILDLVSPGLFLGLSIGRLGCFSAGCCYGKPTESFLGVVFTHPESLAPIGIKIFPTQLFESVYSFLIFVVLHYMQKKDLLNGRLFFIGGILYSIFRFFNEFLRGDDRGGLILGLYPSQFISIVIFVLFSILIFCISKWKEKLLK